MMIPPIVGVPRFLQMRLYAALDCKGMMTGPNTRLTANDINTGITT